MLILTYTMTTCVYTEEMMSDLGYTCDLWGSLVDHMYLTNDTSGCTADSNG